MFRRAALAAAVLLCLTLAACWDRRELDELAVVLGLAIEEAENGGLALTVEVAHRQAEENGESRLFSAEGKNLATALDALDQQMDKYYFWGNTVLLLLDNQLGERETAQLCEQLYRTDLIGGDTLLVSLNGKAEDMLEHGYGESGYTSQGITQAVEQYYQQAQRRQITLFSVLEDKQNGNDRPCLLPELYWSQGELLLREAGI